MQITILLILVLQR